MPQCMLESPYLSCVQQTTFTHNSILTMTCSGCLGWVCGCRRRLCAWMCARESNCEGVCVCVWEKGKTILATQPFLFNEEWKTGIQRCSYTPHINACAPDVRPHLQNDWHRSAALCRPTTWEKPLTRSHSITQPTNGHKDFRRRTSCSLTRRKAGPRNMMFGCFWKDSPSQQIVQ